MRPLMPNSEKSLNRRPSIHTVSKALRTSRKQLKTLPRSSIWFIDSKIVNEASVQPTLSLNPNCIFEKSPICSAKFSNLLRRTISKIFEENHLKDFTKSREKCNTPVVIFVISFGTFTFEKWQDNTGQKRVAEGKIVKVVLIKLKQKFI